MAHNRKSNQIVLSPEYQQKLDELADFIRMQAETPGMRKLYTELAKGNPAACDALTMAWLLDKEIGFHPEPLQALLTALAKEDGESPAFSAKLLFKATETGNALLATFERNSSTLVEAVVFLAVKKGKKAGLVSFSSSAREYYEHE